MTTLGTLIGWFFYGTIRYIIFWIPLLTPPAVTRSIPWQWWRYNTWSEWRHNDDNNGGPDEVWLQAWFRMIFTEALILTEMTVRPYIDGIKDRLRGLIGAIKTGYSSMSGWVDWLERLFGLPLPWWSTTLNRGLRWLRLKLPPGIREAWRTWDQIWEGIKTDVKNWVHNAYDAFRTKAASAWNWVTDKGASLQRWRNRVAGWIDAFRNDPYGKITSWLGGAWHWLLTFRNNPVGIIIAWLGNTWQLLSTFARDCLIFYYNLWSIGWRVLGEFCSDPLGYLYRKAEEALIERW